MSTRIYGHSDDCLEFDGDVHGEVGCFQSASNPGVLVVCSDGTVLVANYGKPNGVIWSISLLRKGELFESIEVCIDEDATPHSDIAYFKTGMKWAYAATEWEKVK